MNEAGFGNLNYPSGYKIPGSQTGKTPADQTKTTGTQQGQAAKSASSISASLESNAIVQTSTKSDGGISNLSTSQFEKLGINSTLPEPGSGTTSDEIDLTNPNMNGLMALLNTLISQLSIGTAKSQIETLKSMDAEIVSKVKQVQQEIKEQIEKAKENSSGFNGFIAKICENDGLNKIANGLKLAGPYTSVIIGSITMALLIIFVIICPLAIVLMPGAIFMFIDGVDQVTGNHIYNFVGDVITKFLIACGMDKEEAERVAKVINYVIYMVGMCACVALSGWNPVLMGPLLMICMTMGRSGQGFQDTNALIDKKAQAEQAIEQLKAELLTLLQRREIIAKKIQEIIKAELDGEPIKQESQEELQKEIDAAIAGGTPGTAEEQSLINQTDFTTNDPNALLTNSSGENTISLMKSPEMTEILLDIMQQIGIKFKKKEDGTYSLDTSNLQSQSPGIGAPTSLTDNIISSMTQNDQANLISAFLAKVMNTPQLFQTVVRDLQQEVSDAINYQHANDEMDDFKHSGDSGMI
jgi:hypothetical protein